MRNWPARATWIAHCERLAASQAQKLRTELSAASQAEAAAEIAFLLARAEVLRLHSEGRARAEPGVLNLRGWAAAAAQSSTAGADAKQCEIAHENCRAKLASLQSQLAEAEAACRVWAERRSELQREARRWQERKLARSFAELQPGQEIAEEI